VDGTDGADRPGLTISHKISCPEQAFACIPSIIVVDGLSAAAAAAHTKPPKQSSNPRTTAPCTSTAAPADGATAATT